MSFRHEHGRIVGHGFSIAAPGGYAVVDADLLNRLIDLILQERVMGADDATRVVAMHRRMQERIEGAKDDLVEALGIELPPGERR